MFKMRSLVSWNTIWGRIIMCQAEDAEVYAGMAEQSGLQGML